MDFEMVLLSIALSRARNDLVEQGEISKWAANLVMRPPNIREIVFKHRDTPNEEDELGAKIHTMIFY
jgi:hypothetical protein